MIFSQSLDGDRRPSKVWLTLLGFGLFVQMSGLLFNNDGSRQATQAYLLLFLPAMFFLLRYGRLTQPFWRQPAMLILSCLLAWVLIRAGFGGDSPRPYGYWLKVVLLIVLYLFAVAAVSRSALALHRLIVATAAVAAVFAWLTLYYQFMVLDKPLSYEAIRMDGRLREMGWNDLAALGHPIVAGLYYGVFIVLFGYLAVTARMSIWRVLLISVAMLGLLAYLLLTFSRGAWFSTAAGGVVMLLLFPNDRSRALLLAAFLGVCAMLGLFWPEVQNEWHIGTSRRDLIWLNWLESLPSFWLLGDGAGVGLHYTYPWGDEAFHAHSLYLQLWYEYGVTGILLFALLLIALLVKGWKLRSQVAVRVGMALLVFAMVAMVSDIDAIFCRPNVYWVIFWFPVGILLGACPTTPVDRLREKGVTGIWGLLTLQYRKLIHKEIL